MKLTVSSLTTFEVYQGLVRFPDPLADGSDFFKVRRGPCLIKVGQPIGLGEDKTTEKITVMRKSVKRRAEKT